MSANRARNVPRIAIDGTARLVVTALVSAVGYFVLSKIGLAFIEPSTHVAVIWIAAGFALATLLVVPHRAWPVVVAGIFVGNLVAQLSVRKIGWLSAGLAAVNALAPLLVVVTLALMGRRTSMWSIRPARSIARLLVAVVAANSVSSLVGAWLVSTAFGGSLRSAFATWYFADALGFLMVAPMVIAFRQPSDHRTSLREQATTLVGTTALAGFVFFPEAFGVVPTVPLPLLIVPVLLWSALQAGLRVTSVLLLAVGAIGAFAVAHEYHSVVPGVTGVAAQVVAFQMFLAVVIVCTMLVSAVAAESYWNEQSAQEGRERFESILRALTEYAVIGTDHRTGMVTFFNVGAERLLGYAAADVVGRRSARDLHVPAEIEQRMDELGVTDPLEALTLRASEGHPESRRWTYRRADGSEVRVMVTISAECDLRNQLIGYIAVARELTEQERQEHEIRDSLMREREIVARLRAANETRSGFVSTVSHELRTPLTNVVGFTEMLRTGDFGELSASQLTAITRVEANGHRLLQLVDDLLTMNGMDTGSVTLDEQDVELAASVRAAVDQVALMSQRSDVALEVDVTGDDLVRGDAQRIERMLVNIIGNAVKFTPAGGVVKVSLVVDGHARIVVSDSGIGIPADELDQVFERFFRAREAFARAVPGTGLGLPIARSIAEAHGGSIAIESEPGVGTTVTVELPVRLSRTQRTSSVTMVG